MRASRLSPVDASISILCEHGLTPNARSVHALCTLVSWMHWPDKPKVANAMSNVFYARFLANGIRDGGAVAADIVALAKETGFDFFFLDPEVGFILSFFKSDQDDISYLAQVTRFLISYEPEFPGSKRQAASLGKAYYGLENGIYGLKTRYSPAKRDAIWRSRKESAAFIAADILSAKKLTGLDISSKNLAHDMSAIISQPESLNRFFGMVKWTQERLIERLNKSALTGARFPIIPEHINSAQISLRRTDQKQRDLMKSYHSNFD